MSDKQPSKRLLRLAVTDAVKTRLISKSAFKQELEKPQRMHLKCLANKEDNAYQSMTNLLPQRMINLLKEIDEKKKQHDQCNSTWRNPKNDRHDKKLNSTLNKKIGYSRLNKEQDFRFEDSKWNTDKLATNHECRKNLNFQYTENKKGTNTTNLTMMNKDSDEKERKFFSDCDYTKSDFQVLPSNCRTIKTCSTSPNLCTESILTNKDVRHNMKIQYDCNQFVMPSVADEAPCLLERKSVSTPSFPYTETNYSINCPSLFLSSHDLEPTGNKKESSVEFQNFKKREEEFFQLGSETNFQSNPLDYKINNFSLMMKESAAQSINNHKLSANPVDITKLSDSPLKTFNSDFYPTSHLDPADKHFQLNSESVKEDEISDPTYSQYSLTNFGKNHFPLSKYPMSDTSLNNGENAQKYSKRCSFSEEHLEKTFHSAFKYESHMSFSNFEDENATHAPSFLYSPKANVFEETNAYQTFNDDVRCGGIKTSENASFSMERLIDSDSNSKIFSPIHYSEFPMETTSKILCSKHDAETSRRLSKEMGKCQIFENDSYVNFDEMHLPNELRNNNYENSDFLKKLHALNGNSGFQCSSQEKLCVSFDDSEVPSNNPCTSYNTHDYAFLNSLPDHECNILQHSKLNGFIESSEIKEYVLSECESDYINNLINELM